METKVFCIYILLGILFDIIDLIYRYGEYNIFPKVVTQEKINELIRKLEPYNVIINTIKLMQ